MTLFVYKSACIWISIFAKLTFYGLFFLKKNKQKHGAALLTTVQLRISIGCLYLKGYYLAVAFVNLFVKNIGISAFF